MCTSISIIHIDLNVYGNLFGFCNMVILILVCDAYFCHGVALLILYALHLGLSQLWPALLPEK